MGLLDDVTGGVTNALAGSAQTYAPTDVPLPEDLGLRSGKAADFEAAMLFIDVRQSSSITEAFRLQTAAKMIRAYTNGTVRIVHANSGKVRSFNGDGMLAVFIGNRKCNNAVGAALQCRWFVAEILRKRFATFFSKNEAARRLALGFHVGCGIDVGRIYAVRAGIGGTNDIAWVGRPTNTAAKLATGRRSIAITSDVFRFLDNTAGRNVIASDGRALWSEPTMSTVAGAYREIRTSTWRREIT